MKIRIYYEDTDAGGVVYHTNYIKFCERARSELFFTNDIPMNDIDGYFVVKSLEADFIQPAILGDILEIKTTIIETKKISLILQQDIYKNDKKIFKLTVKIVYMKNSKMTAISKEKLSLLENFL
jgi:acyl-CoA thioester hydrolase